MRRWKSARWKKNSDRIRRNMSIGQAVGLTDIVSPNGRSFRRENPSVIRPGFGQRLKK